MSVHTIVQREALLVLFVSIFWSTCIYDVCTYMYIFSLKQIL